jgi:hypothetical protein
MVFWSFVALTSFATVYALISARLLVTPDQIIVSSFGVSRTLPVAEIDSRRFDELAYLGLFQLSLHNGQFIVVPSSAFADGAPFTAIRRASSEVALSRPDPNQGEAS